MSGERLALMTLGDFSRWLAEHPDCDIEELVMNFRDVDDLIDRIPREPEHKHPTYGIQITSVVHVPRGYLMAKMRPRVDVKAIADRIAELLGNAP